MVFKYPTKKTPAYVHLYDPQLETKCCRICLQSDALHDMIAPCSCSGTQKWCHRECLDLWRTNEQSRAFSQCTTCLDRYQLEPPPRDWMPKMRFVLFVSRDVLFVTLAVQLVICGLGYLVSYVDKDSQIVDFLDHGLCSPENYSCHHALAVYYLCGTLAFLVVLGLIGLLALSCDQCRVPEFVTAADPPLILPFETPEQRIAHYQQARRVAQGSSCCATACCEACICSSCCYWDCCCCGSRRRRGRSSSGDGGGGGFPPFFGGGGSGGGGNGGGGGDCSGCAGGGKASASGGKCAGILGKVLVVIGLVILITMAIIGFCFGILMCIIIGQNIAQRHLFRLQKKKLVQEFRVKDLSKIDEEEGSLGDPLLPLVRSELQPEDKARLRKLGLWMG